MKYQASPHLCSAAALQSALRCMGVRMGQGRLAKAIGVTEDGADHTDIIRAVDALGLRHEQFESSAKADARRWLLATVPKHPVILAVDKWGHWICVAGMCGDRMFLFDSAREHWNETERGTWVLAVETVMKRWKASRAQRKSGGLYYGIQLSK